MRTATAALDTEFAASREYFDSVVGFLKGDAAAGLEHGQLVEHLAEVGRELIRLLQQDHANLRAVREERLDEVAEVDGSIHTTVSNRSRDGLNPPAAVPVTALTPAAAGGWATRASNAVSPAAARLSSSALAAA